MTNYLMFVKEAFSSIGFAGSQMAVYAENELFKKWKISGSRLFGYPPLT